jgi:5-methyltetrahydropteroyltriglutamate--homocysteine methyltransferase
MTVCTHLCRSNFASAWVAEGAYGPVAEVLFKELKVDGPFLELDSPRAGNFAPLRYLPPYNRLNLGL